MSQLWKGILIGLAIGLVYAYREKLFGGGGDSKPDATSQVIGGTKTAIAGAKSLWERWF